MIRPVIIATYWFASSSGSGTYETLCYADGTVSCGCPGWTRRVDKAGNRSCKHTRLVEAGLGATMSIKYTRTGHAAEVTKAQRQPAPTPGQRKLILPK